MTNLLQGWSRPGPWLYLSKNFGGFNCIAKPMGLTHIMKRKKRRSKMFLLSLYLLDIVNTLKVHRGYSNVFVKYVFYFTSEVENIYIS